MIACGSDAGTYRLCGSSANARRDHAGERQRARESVVHFENSFWGNQPSTAVVLLAKFYKRR
jgi:hypothetical protein